MAEKTVTNTASGSILTASTPVLNTKDFVQYATEKEIKTLFKTENLCTFAEIKIATNADKKGEAFKQGMQLYETLFPNKDERESTKDITDRLKKDDGTYHVLIAVDKGEKNVIGYNAFSTVPLADKKVMVYWQYGGVADNKYMQKRARPDDNFRRQGIGTDFYVIRHGLAAQDAQKMGHKNGVVGTILEAEFPGQGETASDIAYTASRLDIHNKNGAKIMLAKMADGSLMSLHMQPKLDEDSNPLMLLMLFRPLNYTDQEAKTTTTMDKKTARSIIMSWIGNFDKEEFDPKDVDYARQILKTRLDKAVEILLVPPSEVPTMTEMAKSDPVLREQIIRDYGSFEAHEKLVNETFASGVKPERVLGE